MQTRFYSYCVQTGEKKRENHREYVLSPFDGEMAEVVSDFDEFERREVRSKKVSRARTIQNIYDYARANHWEYFITLTFSPDKVDRFDYSVCQKRLTQWLNNMRKKYPDMKYLVVPELHMGKDSVTDAHGRHAWHFHGLVSGIGECLLNSGHKTRKGQPIYNIGKYRLGFSTATIIDNEEACCKYITKYITKELCEVTKGRKRYWVSRNCNKPVEETACLDREDADNMRKELGESAVYSKTVESMGADGIVRAVTYMEHKGVMFYFPTPEESDSWLYGGIAPPAYVIMGMK